MAKPRNSIGSVTSVEGLGDIVAALRALEKRMRSAGIDRALRAASKPMVAAIRQEVPVETGSLKKSIGLKLRTYKGKSRVSIIGARVKAYQTELGKRNPAYYAHLVEFGVRPHDLREKRKVLGKGVYRRIGKNARMHPGHDGTGSMRRGFEKASPQAKAELIRVLREIVETNRPLMASPQGDEG